MIVLDANGNVCDYDDDMRNDGKAKKLESMTTSMYTKKTSSVSELQRSYEKLFHVNFVKTGNNPTGTTQNESWLPTVSEDSGEPKSEQEKAFLNPSQAYEHLVARNVYESVLTINDKLIEETNERTDTNRGNFRTASLLT